MTSHTPPSGNEEAGAGFGFDILEVRHTRVLGVGAEAVLLIVDGAEDVISEGLDSSNSSDTLNAQINGVDRQISGLNGVGEWYPHEITKRQHHTEAVLDDVHGSQDGGFHVERVERVDCLSDGDKYDGVRDAAKVAVLLHNEGEIDDDPAEHTRAKLAPRLNVDLTEDG